MVAPAPTAAQEAPTGAQVDRTAVQAVPTGAQADRTAAQAALTGAQVDRTVAQEAPTAAALMVAPWLLPTEEGIAAMRTVDLTPPRPICPWPLL